ncbi:MAG: hypothetical protein ACRDA4_10700 [Filifactoraceae bacterium]
MLEVDRFGRLKYNKEFFGKTGSKWTKEDMDYLIGWYTKIGSEEMAFALERTETSILQRVNELRRKGYKIDVRKNNSRLIPRDKKYTH